MQHAIDSVLEGKLPSNLKSTFLITPIISHFPLSEILTICKVGDDFSIWEYIILFYFCFY